MMTHTKILCYAIAHLNDKMNVFTEKREALADNNDEALELLNALIEPLQAEKEILMQLYKIETGVEYNG